MEADTPRLLPGLPGNLRLALWGAIAALLLLPALAMQFTREVAWGPGDFIVAAGLLGLTGIGIEYAARMPGSALKRLAVAGAVVALLLVVWAELAVGIF